MQTAQGKGGNQREKNKYREMWKMKPSPMGRAGRREDGGQRRRTRSVGLTTAARRQGALSDRRERPAVTSPKQWMGVRGEPRPYDHVPPIPKHVICVYNAVCTRSNTWRWASFGFCSIKHKACEHIVGLKLKTH